jgi:hypothetical protein
MCKIAFVFIEFMCIVNLIFMVFMCKAWREKTILKQKLNNFLSV